MTESYRVRGNAFGDLMEGVFGVSLEFGTGARACRSYVIGWIFWACTL
jgi:hypothetical protein